MPGTQPPNPMTARQTLDHYFLDARARLLDLAATLDRLDRCTDASTITNDPRLTFIRDALTILQSSDPNRTTAIQMRYSR
jgi:hypothetical protein